MYKLQYCTCHFWDPSFFYTLSLKWGQCRFEKQLSALYKCENIQTWTSRLQKQVTFKKNTKLLKKAFQKCFHELKYSWITTDPKPLTWNRCCPIMVRRSPATSWLVELSVRSKQSRLLTSLHWTQREQLYPFSLWRKRNNNQYIAL